MATSLHTPPAHKQIDPAKAPGQIVNPIPPSKLYKPAHGGYPDAVPVRQVSQASVDDAISEDLDEVIAELERAIRKARASR